MADSHYVLLSQRLHLGVPLSLHTAIEFNKIHRTGVSFGVTTALAGFMEITKQFKSLGGRVAGELPGREGPGGVD